MKIFATKITAVSPITGELLEYAGPNVEALSEGMAKQYLQDNGLGYCEIVGEILSEVENEKQTDHIDSQLN